MTKKKVSKKCPTCGCIFPHTRRGRKFCSIECCFLSKATKPFDKDECYGWKGSKHPFGYGDFRYDGKYFRAHVFSYDYYVGGRSNKEHVLHKCDNPSCSNPKHLFLGNQITNMADMAKKGRNGNRTLSDTNVFEIKDLIKNGFSQTHVASLYNISRTSIRAVIHKRTYKYLP